MHWIIGDIHGMLRPLEALIPAIEARDPQRTLIFAGDYVNRGPNSRKVIDYLLTLKAARFLRGNHDDVFELIFNRAYPAEIDDRERVNAFHWFMQFGLYQTLQSYRAEDDDLLKAEDRPGMAWIEKFTKLIPREHLDFIRNLELCFDAEDFFVLHAKWDIRRSTQPSLAQQLAAAPVLLHEILWERFTEAELTAAKAWERIGYFGHTPTITYGEVPRALPILGEKMVLVDTGAALPQGQVLTAFCHETREFIQADSAGKLPASLPPAS